MWNPVIGEVKRGVKVKMGECVSWASLKRIYNLLQHPLMDDQLWEDVVSLSQVHR